ncbi:MAG TPA: hypothetical protein VFU38_03555 [Candidatus Krumholzibacteria bacterium]|nr:hypothetical protein [Candidatus Krumholzibacteria bacterium]
MNRAVFVSALIAGLITSLAVADNPVTGSIEAVKVVVGESGEEKFLPANEARPQDVIEYRLKYANRGEEVVSKLSITDPVPAGACYVAKTVRAPKSATVKFSVDGAKTFHAWPVRVKQTDAKGKEVWVDATPDMITHIRWTLSGDLAPKDEISFSYRAEVE